MDKSSDDVINYKNLAIVTSGATLFWSLIMVYHYFLRDMNIIATIIISIVGILTYGFDGKTKYKTVAIIVVAPILATKLSMSFIGLISASEVEKHYETVHKAVKVSVKEIGYGGPKRNYNISYLKSGNRKARGKAATNIACEYGIILSPYVICSVCDKEGYNAHIDSDINDGYYEDNVYPR